MAKHSVGKNVRRKEGVDKVLGTATYIDDLTVPGMIFGGTVRSTIPKGKIVSVERDPSFDWTGFTYVDHRDIPGKNVVALIEEDQPLLAVDRVNHQAEAIALLAHADRLRLEQGLRAVKVIYEAERPTLTLDAATVVLKEIGIHKGAAAELDQAFRDADLVVEGTYTTGAQEQLYIETHGVIAMPPEGALLAHVLGSMQCPYYVEKALCKAFAASHNQVRVVQTTTGGGFGGKEDYPSILSAHAALLAKKSGQPVKMIYDRHEDLIATTKRHPAWTHHRTGVRRDGTIVAMDIDFRLDGGAYVTLSPVVLSRGSIHAAGPYRVPHVRIRGRVYQTNTPPNGAFRGFGAPQSIFAVEVHLDRIAQKLGIDPVELRRRNLLAVGDSTATGQVLRESVSAKEALDAALARHAAVHKKAKRSAGKRRDERPMLRGTGVAMFLHGSGFTGAGEVRLQARAALELQPRGARILVSSTEIGQGTRTMLAQIVADGLGLPYDRIETMDPDTAEVPDSGPTVASRTCMIVGKILERAAQRMKKELGDFKTPKEFEKLAKRRLAQGPLIVEEQYQRPPEMKWDDEAYRGDAYGAYAWGCNIVDLEIDPLTYAARATHCVAAIDIGRAIHPRLAEGQIEGGTLQAIGWALHEDVVMKDGKMQNANLTNYIIPTTLDSPELHVVMLENPYSHGPQGAKGVGECPIDGPAAAVVNALYQAGVTMNSIPATPERIARALTA